MRVYTRVQYPVTSSSWTGVFYRMIELILTKSCDSYRGYDVMKHNMLDGDITVFYIMNKSTDEIHGECTVDPSGVVTYRIADTIENGLDGTIKVNLVHGITDYLDMEKKSKRAVKMASVMTVLGIAGILFFALTLTNEGGWLTKGVILGVSFCAFVSSYITINMSIKNRIKTFR